MCWASLVTLVPVVCRFISRGQNFPQCEYISHSLILSTFWAMLSLLYVSQNIPTDNQPVFNLAWSLKILAFMKVWFQVINPWLHEWSAQGTCILTQASQVLGETMRIWATQVLTKWLVKKLQISRYKLLTLRMDRPRFPDLCFNKKVANFCLALYLASVASCYAQLLLEGAALLQKLHQACWDACYVC